MRCGHIAPALAGRDGYQNAVPALVIVLGLEDTARVGSEAGEKSDADGIGGDELVAAALRRAGDGRLPRRVLAALSSLRE